VRILQLNLHHSRAALAALCVATKRCDVALIQEPWTYKGEIKGLVEVGGESIYRRYSQYPRTCILVKKGFQILPLLHHYSRDLTAVKIKTSADGDPKVTDITITTIYAGNFVKDWHVTDLISWVLIV
jgi:hypothetical protein